ncbi:MAG: dihydrofolate reductase [Limnobacter sp.]|nr:dihydrofolate reductase [Limnobacter sp.]
MTLKLIAAKARNGVIGHNNRLPWRLPEDLAFFKQTTMGCPVVMGRKTWDSIGRPLPGRLNVVITRNPDWRPGPDKNGDVRPVCIYPDPLFEETQIAIAYDLYQALEWTRGFDTLFLIGGANLYQQALDADLIDEMVITEINTDFEGDAFFPEWEPSRFEESDRTTNGATGERQWTFDFVRYIRKTANQKE